MGSAFADVPLVFSINLNSVSAAFSCTNSLDTKFLVARSISDITLFSKRNSNKQAKATVRPMARRTLGYGGWQTLTNKTCQCLERFREPNEISIKRKRLKSFVSKLIVKILLLEWI